MNLDQDKAYNFQIDYTEDLYDAFIYFRWNQTGSMTIVPSTYAYYPHIVSSFKGKLGIGFFTLNFLFSKCNQEIKIEFY